MTIEIEPISGSDYKSKRKNWGKQPQDRDRAKMKRAINAYEKMSKKPNEYHNSER